MIKKKMPGVYITEYDLGELYSYLVLFNKVYDGYEEEVDVLLSALLGIYTAEYAPEGTAESLSALRNNRGAGRKPVISDEQRAEVIRLSHARYSLREIAERSGVSRSSAQRILTANKQRVSHN